MHVKNADLHISYAAPVRVSVAKPALVVTRAEIFVAWGSDNDFEPGRLMIFD